MSIRSTLRRVDRDLYRSYVAAHAARDYSVRDDETGKAAVVHYDRSGNIIAAAAYGIAPRPVYKIKVAH